MVACRRVLLMVKEDNDTAPWDRCQLASGNIREVVLTTCLILEIECRAIIGSTADISHLRWSTPAKCDQPPTKVRRLKCAWNFRKPF